MMQPVDQIQALTDQQYRSLLGVWFVSSVSLALSFAFRRMVGSKYYYLLFAVASLGMLLHFPRKKHVFAAYYKPQ